MTQPLFDACPKIANTKTARVRHVSGGKVAGEKRHSVMIGFVKC